MTSEHTNRPIPWREHPPTAMDYKGVPVDLTDPRSEEQLVDLANYGVAGTGFYARDDGLNAPYGRAFACADKRVRARRSVAERLAQVNARLSQSGIEVFVLNGFRPLGWEPIFLVRLVGADWLVCTKQA